MTTTPTAAALPRAWRDLEDALAANLDRLLLYGPPGTGKTYSALTHGTTNAHRLTCVDDMTSAHVAGMWRPNSSGGWSFSEGPAPRAWRAGARLVIDEIDKASGDVLGTLLEFADSEASARWENPETGETITPAPGFSIVATTNSAPRFLADALRDRFPVALEITEPHPDALAALPEMLREPARQLAQAPEGERLSLRAFHAIARLAERYDLDRAISIVAPQHAEALAEAISVSSLEATK